MESPQAGTTLMLCQGVEHLCLLLEAIVAELRVQRGQREEESVFMAKAECWKPLHELEDRRRRIFGEHPIIAER